MRAKIKTAFYIYLGIIIALTLSDCKEYKEFKFSNSLISANEINANALHNGCNGPAISFKEFYGRLIETCKSGAKGELIIINEIFPNDKNKVCLGTTRSWVKSGLYVESIVGNCDQLGNNEESKIVHFKVKY